ncbi:MAG TPA: TIGR03943 family protein [Actinomycetota bacterium]|nr:TIGR03943 family protein [Actinomycetota bacterium]
MSAVRTAEGLRLRERAARSICPSRVLDCLALGSWAGVFWWLLITDRTSLFLSTRTAWVVPTGAILLTVGLLGRLLSLRTEEAKPITARSAWGVGLIVMPVITVLALPPASLGSYAAERRSTFSSGGIVASADDIATGDLSLLDVAGGLRSRDGVAALSDRAGEEVAFTGFVTKDPGAPADEFVLTRFMVSCCVADALSVNVRVVGAPPGRFEADEWVRVSGNFYPLGRDVIVDSTDIVVVERPKRPYLSS